MEPIHNLGEETWYIEATSLSNAREKGQDRLSKVEEEGGSGGVEYEGIHIEAEDTISFKMDKFDDDVGSIYKFKFTPNDS